MKGKLFEFKGRRGSGKEYAISPICSLVRTNPDEFNEVLLEHPEGFSPNEGEVKQYQLDKEKTYVWVQVVELKLM